jgi:hypothetical protein
VAAPDPAVIRAAEEAAYRRGFSDGERTEWRRAMDAAIQRNSEAISKLNADLSVELAKLRDDPPATGKPAQAPRPAAAPVQRPEAPRPPAPRPAARAAPNEGDGSVPAGCAKPLAALAAVYPSGLTEAQWSMAAGYKRSGGTWGTYKSRLRGAGLIETREGRWFATEAGATAAGDVELPPPPGPDLVRWWAAKLPGTSKMAEALIEAWPADLDRDELAARIDMAAPGGSFGTYLSRLAGPGLIVRDGRTVRLSEEAMGR